MTRLTFISLLMFLVSYSLGINLFLEKPRSATHRLFIVIMMASALDNFAIMLSAMLDSQIILDVMTRAGDLTFIFIPSLYLHFVFVFPERMNWFKNRHWLHIYGVSALFYIPPIVWVIVFARARPGWVNPNLMLGLFESLVILWMLLILWQKYGLTRFELEKKQLIVVGAGLSLNIAVVSLLTAYEMVHQVDTGTFQLLSPVLVFATVGTALLAFKWVNIRAVLRKSLLYGVLMVLILSFYVVVITQINPLVEKTLGRTGWLIEGTLVLLVVLTFNPLKNYLNTAIDRVAFPDRRATFGLLPELLERIHTVLDVEKLCVMLSEFMKNNFHVSGVSIALLSSDIQEGLNWYGDGEFRLENERLKELGNCFSDGFAPIITDESPLEQELSRHLKNSGLALILPLNFGDRLAGMIFVPYAQKDGMFGRSKRPYSYEEVEALAAVSLQLSTAFANALLYEKVEASNHRLIQTMDALEHTERKLYQSEKLAALGKLAAGMAHEIRNPLGVIKLSASTLEELLDSEEQSRELASFIKEEIGRLNRVVTDLLDYARPSKPELATVVLNDEIGQYFNEHLKHLAAGNIELKNGRDRIIVDVDTFQLRRILINLVINAKNACDDKCAHGNDDYDARIRVTLAREGQHAVISVEDNGPGIREDIRGNVFDPFVTTRARGTGLGLAVVRNLVELNKGAIITGSSSMGGALFAIKLPLISG